MILSKLNLQAGLGIGVLLVFGSAAFAQNEAVLIKRQAQLHDAPGEASRSLAPLPVQTAVTRLGERQGPWIKVRMADGTQGWVHMFDITSASSAQGSNAGTGAPRSITVFSTRAMRRPTPTPCRRPRSAFAASVRRT